MTVEFELKSAVVLVVVRFILVISFFDIPSLPYFMIILLCFRSLKHYVVFRAYVSVGVGESESESEGVYRFTGGNTRLFLPRSWVISFS